MFECYCDKRMLSAWLKQKQADEPNATESRREVPCISGEHIASVTKEPHAELSESSPRSMVAPTTTLPPGWRRVTHKQTGEIRYLAPDGKKHAAIPSEIFVALKNVAPTMADDAKTMSHVTKDHHENLVATTLTLLSNRFPTVSLPPGWRRITHKQTGEVQYLAPDGKTKHATIPLEIVAAAEEASLQLKDNKRDESTGAHGDRSTASRSRPLIRHPPLDCRVQLHHDGIARPAIVTLGTGPVTGSVVGKVMHIKMSNPTSEYTILLSDIIRYYPD